MCSVRCAAVSAYMSKRSPLAVRWPCCSRPYHEALPSKTATTPARGLVGTSRIDRRRRGHRLGAAGDAQRERAPRRAPRELPDRRLSSAFLPQLVSRRPVAERRARLLAVALAEDVAQVGHVRERVRVLACVWHLSAQKRSGGLRTMVRGSSSPASSTCFDPGPWQVSHCTSTSPRFSRCRG